MQEKDLSLLWNLFLKSGDIRLYNIYRELSEELNDNIEL